MTGFEINATSIYSKIHHNIPVLMIPRVVHLCTLQMGLGYAGEFH